MRIVLSIRKVLKKTFIAGGFALICLLAGNVFAASAENPFLNLDLFGASFPTELSGWVCGRRGVVGYTADGGKTWVRQNSGTNQTLISICFMDVRTGWAVGDAGTILYTKDGGQTWEPQESPTNMYLMGVSFANRHEGWIATEHAHILHTTDGGRTWEIQFDGNEDLVLRSISFCDAKNGWAAGEYGYIYRTRDGGKTWKQQAGHYDISEETLLLVGGNFIFNIVAVDPETAWAVGIDGWVAKTDDGGKTWRQMKSEEIPRVHLFAVAAGENGAVYLGGNSVLVSSMDGGNTFRKASMDKPVTYGWIGHIAPKGKSGYVAVGRKSSIYNLNVVPEGTWEFVGFN